MVVVQTPQAPPTFPPDPVQVTCPNCQAVVMTVTEPISGLLMWMVVGGICIIGSVARLCLTLIFPPFLHPFVTTGWVKLPPLDV